MKDHGIQAQLTHEHCSEPSPEIVGTGELIPLCKAEALFYTFAEKLIFVSAGLLLLCVFLISIDIIGRLIFDKPLFGISDIETVIMSAAGFLAVCSTITRRESMQIDVIFVLLSYKNRRLLYLFTNLLCFVISSVLTVCAMTASFSWTRVTPVMQITEWPFLFNTGLCFGLTAIAFFFQVCHVLKSIFERKEYLSILVAVLLNACLWSVPILYRISDLSISNVAIGGIVFVVLLVCMLVRAPLGFAMSLMGLLGLMVILRNPWIAFPAIAHIPFTETGTFLMIAIPMFMLMGEMVTLSGLSSDLFTCAANWMGRLPGGLAVATVYGCAGFGAVCGESFATVLTMSSVALPSMEKYKYDYRLSLGCLASGGTLGILIPPSTGFIVYAMITEQSVGALFISGILPGILLATLFSLWIIFQVKWHPAYAPPVGRAEMREKVMSLFRIIPVGILFSVVVFGILYGMFTPADGGAVGVTLALLYAIARRKINRANFTEVMYRSAVMFGKIFILFGGLYVFSVFLASSRLPMLVADVVASLHVNKYAVLLAVTVLYIILGCLMNIIPMMLLTLPTIYPTIAAVGFDPIWFGCYCVILMEMSLITPPVGLNVFTLAGLRPQVPMMLIFKSSFPYALCMLATLVLITIFPEIVLWLVH